MSNLGKVKSLGNNKNRKDKILKISLDGSGYKKVSLCKNSNSKIIKAHQLVSMAFLNHKINGHKLIVDHINNDRLDNRLENLQIITQRENTSKDKKNKSSIYVGVTWHKANNKWVSNIRINGKKIHLGCFNTELEASEAYKNKILKIQ